jgi:hypothetical protein
LDVLNNHKFENVNIPLNKMPSKEAKKEKKEKED